MDEKIKLINMLDTVTCGVKRVYEASNYLKGDIYAYVIQPDDLKGTINVQINNLEKLCNILGLKYKKVDCVNYGDYAYRILCEYNGCMLCELVRKEGH